MESTTQPILCCIGASVAGCPTQYVMERAFAACGLDWRAISVEVAPDLLTIALDGMAAMNFKALRIYPSLDQIAAQALGEFNPLTRFVGSVTSAALTAEGWQAWDHYGFAALKHLGNAIDLSHCVCWLHGDTPQNRSVLAALKTHRAADQAAPARIIWTGRPATLPDALHDLNIESIDLNLRTEPLPHAAYTHEPHINNSHENDSQDDEAQNAPMDDGGPQAAASDLANAVGAIPELLLWVDDTARLSDSLCELLGQHVKHAHLFTRAPLTGRLARAPVTIVSEVDVAIASEAYDFQRWTNQTADCGLFRDAYDEFGAF
jgi:hypothetical protein